MGTDRKSNYISFLPRQEGFISSLYSENKRQCLKKHLLPSTAELTRALPVSPLLKTNDHPFNSEMMQYAFEKKKAKTKLKQQNQHTTGLLKCKNTKKEMLI